MPLFRSLDAYSTNRSFKVGVTYMRALLCRTPLAAARGAGTAGARSASVHHPRVSKRGVRAQAPRVSEQNSPEPY